MWQKNSEIFILWWRPNLPISNFPLPFQFYTPILVIVACSWVAFWIVRTDAPARCGLGITTLLSVIKLGFGGGKNKPQVGYPTALDVFNIICLGTVFAALCEFAIINFISCYIARYKAEEEKRKEAQDKAKDLLEKAKELLEQNIAKPSQEEGTNEDDAVVEDEIHTAEAFEEQDLSKVLTRAQCGKTRKLLSPKKFVKSALLVTLSLSNNIDFT